MLLHLLPAMQFCAPAPPRQPPWLAIGKQQSHGTDPNSWHKRDCSCLSLDNRDWSMLSAAAHCTHAAHTTQCLKHKCYCSRHTQRQFLPARGGTCTNSVRNSPAAPTLARQHQVQLVPHIQHQHGRCHACIICKPRILATTM